MDREKRKKILARGFPDMKWDGEPMLGAWYTEEEIEAVVKTIRDSMDWTVGFGFFCDEIIEFEEQFATYVGTKYAISISSAGAGLDMAMMALDLDPDDEIISPAINFWAADYAILGHCKLIFAEADPRTFCLDPADVEKRITPKTRAINVTHMNGLSAPMDELLQIAEKHPHPKYGPPKVIGDAARACGGEYNGTKVGKKGWMNIFSFHTMKLMTTLGEGGMITTDDAELDQRLRAIRMWGADTDMWGVNYKMTKIQAAAGMVQLRRLDEMNAARYNKAQQRSELLKNINELTLPYEPPGYKHTYYLYTCMVPSEWAGKKRDQLVNTLQKDYGIGCGILNPPTYQMRSFIRQRTLGQDLPVSNAIGTRIFSPSLHPLMSDGDNEYIAASISEAVEHIAQEKIEDAEAAKKYRPEVALKDTELLFSDGSKKKKTT
jgi:dTDP-4-amino-4,6-dideoxygalactose transaminase